MWERKGNRGRSGGIDAGWRGYEVGGRQQHGGSQQGGGKIKERGKRGKRGEEGVEDGIVSVCVWKTEDRRTRIDDRGLRTSDGTRV